MRKFISIVLVFTVNLLFLTHAVLPHHHHEGIPHFLFMQDHEHQHEHSADDCCCTPDNCNDDCALDQEIDVIHETKDEDTHCLLCSDSHDHTDFLLQAVLLYIYDFSLPDNEKEVRPPHYLISYHYDHAAQGIGLRAPPVIS